MSVCQMISTYHTYDDLLRKLAKRYQAALGNHNILIYPEWQAFLSLTFVQGILHNGRAVYLSPPPTKRCLVSPLTGIRGSSVLNVSDTIDASLFKDTLEAVKEKCPLIYSMVESLVISNLASRNILRTNTHKMLCGLHMLGILSNIRNQRTINCFPLIFGFFV